jgi:hypothetical protein
MTKKVVPVSFVHFRAAILQLAANAVEIDIPVMGAFSAACSRWMATIVMTIRMVSRTHEERKFVTVLGCWEVGR